MKSISKPISPSLGEGPCLPKMPASCWLAWYNPQWQVHAAAQEHWAEGLAGSPALTFRQRQSRPAAVVQLLAFLWQTNRAFPLCAPGVTSTAHAGCQKAEAQPLLPGSPSPKGCGPPLPVHCPRGAPGPQTLVPVPSPGCFLRSFPSSTSPADDVKCWQLGVALGILPRTWSSKNFATALTWSERWVLIASECVESPNLFLHQHAWISLIRIQAHCQTHFQYWAFTKVLEYNFLKYVF